MADTPADGAAAPQTPEPLATTLARVDKKLDQVLEQFDRVQDTGAIAKLLDDSIDQLAAIRSRIG